MRIPSAAVMVTSLVAIGCGSQHKDGEVSPSAAAPATSAPPVASVSSSALASSAAVPPTSASAAPSIPSAALSGACTADADCSWDDPCRATACNAKPRTVPECDKSLPLPGDCLCVAGACTLKPAKPPPPVGPCERNGCTVDPAHGTCTNDTKGVPEIQRFSLPVDSGPSCDCDPKLGCVFRWFEPVPCKSDDDCWIDESPRTHPVPKPNGRGPFRPCKDGETSPKCGAAGTCTFGSHWKC